MADTQAAVSTGIAASAGRDRPVRICLAGSGGGHVRQLLDLQPLWADHDYFFVTEDTALGQSLAADHRTYLVPHFAWGQAKLGTPFRMLAAAFRSFFQSASIILRERPDIVISTGAGAVYFPVVWAKLAGARVVVIESFARFEGPSLFGRLAAPLAHDLVVQSPKLAAAYPKAHVFDPMRMLDGPAPAKQPLVFATVGATLPFNRLVESVAALHAEGAIPERILVQTGIGGATPAGLKVVETLPFDEVKALLRDAAIVICHGGTGSLITALREGCQVIAMPRLAELGEHYDDHQAEITSAFAQRGLVLVANSVDELRAALETARTRRPVMATSDPSALIEFLRGVVGRLGARR
ncbi:beta-1,4-glucuronosyltransferase WelK [Phenylobacterium sp.]|jgi:UDP-N-acetylglucosamine transferase subunit ALG13|uniref:beta-1,4-glucuronosyltransferase WelK n=1 Tax=Phenylobacterium sp. TaxID=1871053 RepID=UPI002F3E2C12